MSSSSGMLPFPKILLLASNRSGVGRRTWTDRDLLSVQPQRRYPASGRPILEPYKVTNHLPFNCLHRDQDISPPPLHEGAKIYSLWVGFLAKRNPRRRTSTAVLISRALPLSLLFRSCHSEAERGGGICALSTLSFRSRTRRRNLRSFDLVIPKPNAAEESALFRPCHSEAERGGGICDSMVRLPCATR